MGRARKFFLFVASSVFTWAIPFRADAQQVVVPRGGTFHIERKPAFTFKATLVEHWVSPHAGDGTLRVFAPALPELPGQGKVTTRLAISEGAKRKAEELIEESFGKRPMLALSVPSNELSLKTGITLRLEYEGTLYARTLQRGKPRKAVPKLTDEERRRYLASSATMDYEEAGFVQWMKEHKLPRQRGEDAMRFAHRVFTYFIKHGKYGGDTSNYEARRPSRVCKSLTNDCGGLALLFVAVMRANEVPARTLFGRWAIPQTDEYGQYHVLAEFFVEKSGWVPVDISGTIVHKPKDPNAFFGNTDGQHMAFHVDTDLEPTKGFRHAWAQYLLLQWSGKGDFWKEHQVSSKWDVQRRALTAGRLP